MLVRCRRAQARGTAEAQRPGCGKGNSDGSAAIGGGRDRVFVALNPQTQKVRRPPITVALIFKARFFMSMRHANVSLRAKRKCVANALPRSRGLRSCGRDRVAASRHAFVGMSRRRAGCSFMRNIFRRISRSRRWVAHSRKHIGFSPAFAGQRRGNSRSIGKRIVALRAASTDDDAEQSQPALAAIGEGMRPRAVEHLPAREVRVHCCPAASAGGPRPRSHFDPAAPS